MLYRERTGGSSLRKALLRLTHLFDGRSRRRRRVEMDLLSLSPYLQRDLGFPRDDL
jgi:hypothetical protein